MQAYDFQAGRLASALLTGEASFLDPPARRSRLGFGVGVALTVLIAVGFFLFGMISAASDDDGATATGSSTATTTATTTAAAGPSSTAAGGPGSASRTPAEAGPEAGTTPVGGSR